MFKLLTGVNRIIDKLNQKSSNDFHQFYLNFTHEANHTQTKQKQTNSQYQFNDSNPISIDHYKSQKLSQKKQNKTQRMSAQKLSQQKLSSQNILKPLRHTQNPKKNKTINTLDQQQYLLLSRKKKLLTQLQQINLSLNNHKQSRQSRIIIKKQQKQKQQEMTQKATQLIKKMNQQRQLFTKRRKKQIQELNQSVNKSIKIFQQTQAEQQKLRQIKRKQIQQRIDQRKYKAIQRKIFVQKSNSLIKDLVGSAINTYDNKNKSTHIQKQQGQNNQFNPQIKQNIKTQNSRKSLNKYSQQKLYCRSPFLQRILKQDQRKKKEEYIKKLQKRHIYLKQKLYSDKIRGKSIKYDNNSMFIT